MKRRDFVKTAAAFTAYNSINFDERDFSMKNKTKIIKVVRTDSNFKREKLISPYGFKGGYLSELWQTAVQMESENGENKIGVATQSVLYGDADFFSSHSEAGGNAHMLGLTDKALQVVKETPFSTPIELLDRILPQVLKEGIRMTGKPDLNKVFVYNSLVSIDNAAWLLYAAENQINNFGLTIPSPYQKALSHHNKRVAVIFAIPYSMSMEELKNAATQGYFIFKIKTGYPGSQAEMVEKDMARLTLIHKTLKDFRTNQTEDGKLLYIMDANGRYNKKETLMDYINHAKKIGAFHQILFYEEPLNVNNDENVEDIGIIIAGDESIHDEASALRRLEQGYGAFVLKGIAKTLSLSIKLAKLAQERGVPCVCADLTVNPLLVEWHKNLAARLAPFPRIGMGLMETNGPVNYKNWEAMLNYHPTLGPSWTRIQDGVFHLNDDFYERSGDIYEPPIHYQEMFKGS